MKLSLRKRFGWVHVRGGRLLRVLHAHSVETNTQTLNSHERRRPFHGKSVTAEPGDLAVEIVAAKTGSVLGYSYIAGAALQLNSYDVRSDRYEQIEGQMLTEPVPETNPFPHQEWIEARVKMFMEAKYGDIPVCGLETVSRGPVRNVAEEMAQFWGYEPNVDDPPKSKTNLFAIVRAAKGKEVVILHFQPPMHADDHAATGFQTELVLSAIK